MFVIIVDNNKIAKYRLNESIDYNGIFIYSKNDKYYIDLKRGLYFDDNSKSKQLEIGLYNINLENTYYTIRVYIYESDTGINDFNLYKTTNFIIADNLKANIICRDRYLKDNYLYFKDGYLNSNYKIIVNHNSYNGELLKYGDTIEYLGIKIIYFNDFLYINSFNIDIKLPSYVCNKSIIKYKNINNIDNYYIPDKLYELNIDELDEYKPLKKQNDIDFIKSLLPNLIMCLSMCLMAYMNYINNTNNVAIISYIIMPISMFITSVLIPVIFIIVSNNKYRKENIENINNYLKYLDSYKDSLTIDVNKYVSSLNSRYFDLLNSRNMMFYAGVKTSEYLKLSIGKIVENRHICFKKTDNLDINNKIKEIENIVNNIENIPLYIDLKVNKRVTIVTKKCDKLYYFNSFILETIYKHHYDDINIAIYSQDQNIFNSLFNIPHLFIGDKRLTIDNNSGLQSLDQMVLQKPLIIFMYDKSLYKFTNENIHVVYMSNDISDILKDSDIVVEYINNGGYLYLDGKTKFKYIQEDIDFNNYYSYIGRFKLLESNRKNHSFLDLFNKSIGYYYANNDHSLKASFAYSNNELINFDLHESKQGPHGLIGGSTGSGKSELIVSLLLSLCIRYSPDYLNIVLIDYKGGGLKESLSYNNIPIPHIVSSLTNLQDYALERLIISLKNECKLRQSLFKKLSNEAGVSIMNLDDYLNNNKAEYNLPNISHELIVVDEFAELKKENPQMIKELISISRIGRSLGMHLILATQKPTGVIDDEIWSNSRFKIALKVFDEKDSMDIIKCKDAAYLTSPGSFIESVNNGLINGQSIYSKIDINGRDPYSVSILDNELSINKTYKCQTNKIKTIASYYCHNIIKECLTSKYHPRLISFMPPKPIDRIKTNSFVFGQIDDYINNISGLLSYKLSDTLLIYSSRKAEINSILNTLNENCIESIVISNNQYDGKYIKDSINYDNNEDIEYLFNTLLIHSNTNHLSLVIEDVNCLISYDERYLDILCKLIKRKESLNLSLIVIASNSEISYKLISQFTNKIMINLLDITDLSSFYGCRSEYQGKSFFFSDKLIPFVPVNIEEYHSSNRVVSNLIKHIPNIIKPKQINGEYLLGYDIKTKEPIYSKNFVVVSYDQDLLNIYVDAYKDIKCILYSMATSIDINILWLGSGIFNQRLFVTGERNDLSDDEAIFIQNNKKYILRRLTDVSKINEI